MKDIVLTTLNARYIHTAFGLRYLYAHLGDLQQETALLEFEISNHPQDIAEEIVSHNPKIVGIGVYIWNAKQVSDLIAILKKISPHLIIILGGPEVSYESETHPLYPLCDHIIQGDADYTFATTCRTLLSRSADLPKIIASPIPQPSELLLPYQYYSNGDIENRVIYVEASRGCPFTCEFCLSSLDIPVRQFPLDTFLAAMDDLIRRGAKQFKFVDRTFNLHIKTSLAILNFFLERYTPGMFVHFEMVPDRLPEQLREVLSRFPPGSLQLEIGIQSFNPAVGTLIKRKQDFAKLEDNIRFLRTHTGVHIHADLIVGLPGETLESFGEGFNRLVHLDPQEIQVGILKRLRGTPIVRHDETYAMIYNPNPPYELLSNADLSFPVMQRMTRFAKYWDLLSNSGNFSRTRLLLWERTDPFHAFLNFSDWLYEHSKVRYGFSLKKLAEYLYIYLTSMCGHESERVRLSLLEDFERNGRTDLPRVLRPRDQIQIKKEREKTLPIRQQRHAES